MGCNWGKVGHERHFILALRGQSLGSRDEETSVFQAGSVSAVLRVGHVVGSKALTRLWLESGFNGPFG